MFVLGHVVDDAADPCMDSVSAQIFLVDLEPQRRLDHRRAAGEDLTGALGDHAEVAEAGQRRETAGRRAEHCGGHRREVENLAEVFKLPAIGDVGAAQVGELGHAAAGAVDQVDRREQQLVGTGVSVSDVDSAVVGARGPAPNREILPAHIDAAAVHFGQTAHAADRGEGGQLALFVVGPVPLELAHLVEAARVGQQFDSLAYRELALPMLPLDPGRTAHGFFQRMATRQLVDLLLPAHG